MAELRTTFQSEKPGDRHTRFQRAAPSAIDRRKVSPAVLLKVTVAGNAVLLQYSASAKPIGELAKKFLTVLVIDRFRV